MYSRPQYVGLRKYAKGEMSEFFKKIDPRIYGALGGGLLGWGGTALFGGGRRARLLGLLLGAGAGAGGAHLYKLHKELQAAKSIKNNLLEAGTASAQRLATAAGDVILAGNPRIAKGWNTAKQLKDFAVSYAELKSKADAGDPEAVKQLNAVNRELATRGTDQVIGNVIPLVNQYLGDGKGDELLDKGKALFQNGARSAVDYGRSLVQRGKQPKQTTATTQQAKVN